MCVVQLCCTACVRWHQHRVASVNAHGVYSTCRIRRLHAVSSFRWSKTTTTPSVSYPTYESTSNTTPHACLSNNTALPGIFYLVLNIGAPREPYQGQQPTTMLPCRTAPDLAPSCFFTHLARARQRSPCSHTGRQRRTRTRTRTRT